MRTVTIGLISLIRLICLIGLIGLIGQTALAEPLNALPAHPPVNNPRLRPDDMGSFHDPRGSCVKKYKTYKSNKSNKSNQTYWTYKTYCYGRLHQGIDVINLTNQTNKSDKSDKSNGTNRTNQSNQTNKSNPSNQTNPSNQPNRSVYAIRGGKVVYRGQLAPGLGYTVIVEHEDNYYIIYAHLDKSVIRLRRGQTVQMGEQIGKMGASGNAKKSPYPYQVHIEVIKAPYFEYHGTRTLKWLKRLGEKTYRSNGGLVPPHKLISLREVIPGLADFRDCPKFQMHCTCPEAHGEYCHEFDKNIRCPY